jgi:membrane protease YdiL (CAAX protease family)
MKKTRQMDSPGSAPASLPNAETRSVPGPGLVAAIAWTIALLIIQSSLFILAIMAGLDEVMFLPAILFLPTFLGVVVIVGLKFRHGVRRPLALRGLPLSHAACLLLSVGPLVVTTVAIGHWLRQAYIAVGISESRFAQPPQYHEALQETTLPVPVAVALLALCVGVLPAVSEEFFLRGFLGRGLVARWGVIGGVLLTAVIFGAMHRDLVQSVYAACVGVLLHAAYLWSRSLLAPVLLHAAFNSRGAFLAFIPQDTVPAWLTENAAPPWLLVIVAVLTLAAVCWLYASMRVCWILPSGEIWTPGYPTAEMPPVELSAQPICQRASAGTLVVAGVTCVTFLVLFAWEVGG